MSSLSIFPVEVLENVTSMVTTVDQVHLWQCGNRVLSIKLKKGGLKVTSLKWTSSSWMPWPRLFFATFACIQQVKWCPATDTSFCPALEINLLPKTLLSLQINCGDIYRLLRIQNANMNVLLPLLRTLDITGTRIREENMKHLPQNLITLSMASVGSSLTSDNLFGDLPRTIEVLKLGIRVKDTKRHGNDLPNGLKEFSISGVKASYDWLTKLPHSLTKLSMSTRSTFDWSRLPPLLTELEIPFTRSFVNSMIPQLPQSLKMLHVCFDSSITDDDIALLPKTLVSLDRSSGKLTHVGLQQLPVSVTCLNIGVSATHPDILSFYNPDSRVICLESGPCLQDLKLFPLPIKLDCLDIDFINDDICALLPAGLRYFTVREGLITPKGASKFPKSIVEFDAYFGVFDNNETIAYLSHIPRLLLMADDDTPDTDLDKNWISFLRPATKLPNSAPSTVTPNMTPNMTYLPVGVKEDDLEHRLICLALDCSELDEECSYLLTESVLESLPRFVHLETLTLSIDSGGALRSSCFRFIPENVTDLEIGNLRDFPTADELAMLPKRLKRLYISVFQADWRRKGGITCQWTDEVLQALPRTLQFFESNGSYPKLTPNMNQYVPPYLQEMIGPTHFIKPMDRLHRKERTYVPVTEPRLLKDPPFDPEEVRNVTVGSLILNSMISTSKRS